MTDERAIDDQVLAFRKSPEDDHSQTATQTIDNSNTISTTALLWMLILSIGMSAVAIGVAIMGEREAQNAEREARVALNHSEETKVQTEVNKVLIETFVVKGKQP